MTDNCMASKIGSCCRMFESEVKSKQTNRGVPDGELVVEREVVVVLLSVTASRLLLGGRPSQHIGNWCPMAS